MKYHTGRKISEIPDAVPAKNSVGRADRKCDKADAIFDFRKPRDGTTAVTVQADGLSRSTQTNRCESGCSRLIGSPEERQRPPENSAVFGIRGISGAVCFFARPIF